MTARLARLPMLLAGALSAALMLASCGGGGGGDNAHVRILNAFMPVAGPGPIQVTAGGSAFGPLVSYGTPGIWPGGGYADVTPGVLQASTTVGSSTFSSGYNLVLGSFFTLVAAGREAQTGTFAPALIFIPAYNTRVNPAIGAGQVAIRVINLSPDADSVGYGLYTTPTGGAIAPVVTGVASVAYGYSATAADNQWYVVAVGGLTNLSVIETSDPTETFTFTSPSNLTTFTFTAGRAYTLYVYGSDEGGGSAPLTAVWVEEQMASWTQ